MKVTTGSYMTRSGLAANVKVAADGSVTGTIQGVHYGRRGRGPETTWLPDGAHVLCRVDDLVYTWSDHLKHGALRGER